MPRFERPPLLHLALFFIAYVIAGGFGQGLAIIPGVSIIYWPPAGIFVAMLLLHERPTWPWWIAAACLAELTCNAIWFRNPIVFALLYFAANAFEALTAAWLIDRFVGRPFKLVTLREAVGLAVFGAGLAPVVGATIIASIDAALGKHAFLTAWPLVWLGDGSGLLVSTPLTLVAVEAWRNKADIPTQRFLEAGVIALVIAGIGLLAFQGHLPTVYMTLPALLWAALRFQLRGAAVALGLVALLTAFFTATGRGEFAGNGETQQLRIVMLQTFLGVSAVSALLVAALAQQYRDALARLKSVNSELEGRVAERTAALTERERQARATFDTTAIGIAHLDLEGRFLRVNDRLCEKLGYSREELLGRTWMEISHPDEIATNLELRRAALVGETASYSMEKRYIRKDGDIIWASLTASLVSDDDGKPLYFIAFVRNITERHLADAALRASEERFRAVTRLVPSIVWTAAPDGTITYANEQWFHFCGLTPEANATHWPELVLHPEDRDRCITAWRKSLATGEDYEIEVRNRRHDGVYRWFLTRARALKDAEGRITAWFGTTSDIHDRREAEERLRYQLQLVRNITDTAAVSIFVNDKEGNISFVNPEAERVFGYPLAELKGKSLHEILHHKHPDGRPFPIAECPLGFVYENGEGVRDYEGVFWRKDGAPVAVVCANMPIIEDGQPVGDVITVQDISERKRHEERQQLLIHELNHRVKNTLATVQSIASQSFRSSPDLGEARARFEARLMALSKAHDILSREKWEGAALRDVVERTVAPHANERRERFTIAGPEVRLSPRHALALAMALHELCTNALKYGALSNATGKVGIAWSLARRKGVRHLKMTWRETGGPKVHPPERWGFGTRLIERGLAADLGGEVKLDFATSGLRCTIVAPLTESA